MLRGLAALAVVVFHYAGHCQRYFEGFRFSFEYGRYGVQLFFVISGFFIYQTIEKCRSPGEFLLLRCSRLYPVYWVALVLVLGVNWAQNGAGAVWLTGYLVNASMLQSFLGVPDVDVVFWTLAVEMVFYLLMAVLFATRALARPVAVVLVWLCLANLWWWLQGTAEPRSLLQATVDKLLVYSPFFASGMMFYRLHAGHAGHRAGSLAAIGACMLTAWVTGGLEVGLVALVVIALVGLALCGGLGYLVSPVTLWLGAISYALYLVHRNLGYAAFFELRALGVDSRVAFLLVLAGALALASALTFWIEQPVLRRLRTAIRQRYLVAPPQSSHSTS